MRGTAWIAQGLMGAMLLLTSVSHTFAQGTPWTAWHNALAPQGTPSPQITLVSYGSSNYRIVKPSPATSVETKAATDLQTWIQQITGYQIPILNEGSSLGSRKPISVGRTILLTQAGLPPVGVDLGEDGYGIAVRDGKLFLYGGTKRGAINAVYALLEEDIGCRWYTTSHSRIPSLPVLTVTPVERTYKPALWMRDPFYYVAFNEDWSIRNRTNAPWAYVREDWGGYIDYDGLFVHTVLSLVPPSQYYAAHPEYYMMNASGNRVANQLCLTNPNVKQIVTQKILQTLAAYPNTEILEISKMDTSATCLCPNCTALDNAQGSGMGSLLPLVNYVAEQVEAIHPDVLISTLAYFDTLEPPATIRPRNNVVVRLCNTESWEIPFLPMSQTAFGTLLTSWAAIHDKISVWDYTVNYYNYLAPMPNMQAIGPDIAFMTANNVIGVMTQGGYQGTSERDTMRSWVIAKLLLNPALDWYQMQQDFIWGHYGNSAAKVAEYNDLLHNQYVINQQNLKRPPNGIRFPMDCIFLTADFLNAAEAIFDQAEALADNTTILNRVQRERLPIMYTWLERGPNFTGMNYGPIIDRFETIARREGVTHTNEGSPDLDEKLAGYRAAWQAYMVAVPTIKNQPANRSVCPGVGTTFIIDAGGYEPLTYRWRKNNINITNGGHYSGATTATLTVSSTSSDDAAGYRCVVTNTNGSITSNEVTLTLKTATAIASHPPNQFIPPGLTATLVIVATGEDTLSYRWQKNNSNMSDGGHYTGCTTSSLTVSTVSSNDTADYRCIVTGVCGSQTSNTASLSLIAPGDFDHDGDVDQADFGYLQNCLGAYPSADPTCVSADLNGDTLINGIDAILFARCMTGERIVADIYCATGN